MLVHCGGCSFGNVVPVRWSRLLVCVAAWGMMGGGAGAAILMLDFGSASGAYTGNNSPGHASGLIASSFTTRQAISGTADGSTTDSDANTINYDLGRAATVGGSDAGTNVFGAQPTNISAAAGSGIWSTALTTDAIIDITSANRRDPVAIRLSGLAPGTYDAFLVAHDSGNLTIPQQVGYLVSSSAGITSFASMTGVLTLTLDADDSQWDEGADYYYVQFTVAAGDSVYFMVNNTDNSGTVVPNNNATISMLQLTNEPVPEPATLALLSLGGLLVVRRRGRRVPCQRG